MKKKTAIRKNNKPDYKFMCRNCGHVLYTHKRNFQKRIIEGQPFCPGCGIGFEENWVIAGEGDYSKLPDSAKMKQ
jgi:transcription elongation factor Elf1